MIRCLYGKDFVHNLEVEYSDGFYFLKLHVHDDVWCPLIISLETDDLDAFLKHIQNELKERRLIRSDYLKIELEDGHIKG